MFYSKFFYLILLGLLLFALTKFGPELLKPNSDSIQLNPGAGTPSGFVGGFQKMGFQNMKKENSDIKPANPQ